MKKLFILLFSLKCYCPGLDFEVVDNALRSYYLQLEFAVGNPVELTKQINEVRNFLDSGDYRIVLRARALISEYENILADPLNDFEMR